MMLKRLLPMTLLRRTARAVEQMRFLSPDVLRCRAHVGNEQIAQVIELREPSAIGKIGDCELLAVRTFLRCRASEDCDRRTARCRKVLGSAPGVFPGDYGTFRRWGKLWSQEVLPSMSHLGVWFNFNESWIVRRYAKNANIFHSHGLQPYIFPKPWSAHLAGKKVVVVSPFSRSIEMQYPRRAGIWRDHLEVLPEFKLLTVPCPAHPLLVKPFFADWFEALEDMKRQIRQTDFDVLLVGAGAYSLPLCTYARSLGRIGIHLGGNTQLLFGILGKRWLVKNASIDHRFFNESWVYPLPEETPENCAKIENGGYWK
jgi:hypothetical protein